MWVCQWMNDFDFFLFSFFSICIPINLCKQIYLLYMRGSSKFLFHNTLHFFPVEILLLLDIFKSIISYFPKILCVSFKTQNHPKPPATSQNLPTTTKTHAQSPTTVQNHPQPNRLILQFQENNLPNWLRYFWEFLLRCKNTQTRSFTDVFDIRFSQNYCRFYWKTAVLGSLE